MIIYKKEAFSLIELIVVIAIVALLAAIAVPSYKQYQTKIQIAKYIPIMNQIMMTYAASRYQATGSYPASVPVYGVNVTGGSWFTINNNNIVSSTYTAATDGKGAYISFNLSGLNGIPGYSSPPPTSPASNTFSIISFAVRDMGNGVTRVACGQVNNDTVSIPLSYLPSSCQCANTDSFYKSGTGGC